MRAFDSTPSPSPPPSLRGLGRRSKSPSPFFPHPGSNVSLAAVVAAAAAAAAAAASANGNGTEHASSTTALESADVIMNNPTFPLPLTGSHHAHTHPIMRSQRPRRMSSRCSVRASTPVMSALSTVNAPAPATAAAGQQQQQQQQQARRRDEVAMEH